MGLETSENETIHLLAFGGQASAVRHLPLVTLNIVTTSGEKIPLRVLVVEKMATPLQTHLQQGVEHLPHLGGLKLAHLITSDENFDVSLLIGADQYWDLVEEDPWTWTNSRRFKTCLPPFRTIANILRHLFNYCCELAADHIIYKGG